MKARDLIKFGFKQGPAIGVALKVVPEAISKLGREVIEDDLRALLTEPNAYTNHPHLALLAKAVLNERAKRAEHVERAEPAPYRIWGENLEAQAVDQMKNAARLPVAVAGALMPDAHVGYGLPIGGVLATDNAVIPYAVGVDIACRMRLTVFDIPASDLKRLNDQLAKILERETTFGTGAESKRREDHEVLHADWNVTPVTAKVFEKARAQIGTSGSGNHFVEFGVLIVDEDSELGAQGPVMQARRQGDTETRGQGEQKSESNLLVSLSPGPLVSSSPEPDEHFLLSPGQYLALLSHSGSRGAGAMVASYYSNLAMELHPELPPELRRLAWLDLASEPGREYWAAMELMGQYAAANHALIHQRITGALGAKVLAGVENHHNFAWKESHGGRDVIVHRKGATPAGKGVLGVIPGSMATPGYVVRGRGSAPSLESASHGAGRTMSRTTAKEQFNWSGVKPMLESAGVRLLSAGIDEVPPAYKDIHSVMAAQRDLVDVIARFDPKIVKMAPAGEKPED